MLLLAPVNVTAMIDNYLLLLLKKSIMKFDTWNYFQKKIHKNERKLLNPLTKVEAVVMSCHIHRKKMKNDYAEF